MIPSNTILEGKIKMISTKKKAVNQIRLTAYIFFYYID